MVPCLAKIHLGCSEELSREHLTIPALLPEEPETPDTPATPGDGADGDGGYTPAVTVIEDQEVPLAGLLPLHQLLEAVPIGAGTHLDGKFFVWLRQKLLKSVRIPASFFLARQKFFLPICIPSPIGTASYLVGYHKPDEIPDTFPEQRQIATQRTIMNFIPE